MDTPLEIREALKSWMLSQGMGRATRKNKKDYGRLSVRERKRAPSRNELRQHMSKNQPKFPKYRSS